MNHRASPGPVLLALVATLLAATATPGGPARRVVLLLAPALTDPDAITAALRGHLADLEVEVETEAVAGADVERAPFATVHAARARHEAVAAVRLDAVAPSRVRLTLVGPAPDRALVRELELSPGTERDETVAVIIRGAIEALLAGGTIGVVVPAPVVASAPPPPPSGPVAPAPVDPSADWGLGVGYAFEVTDGSLGASHGLDLALRVGLGRHLALEAGYTFRPAGEVDDPDLTLRVVRFPLRLGLALRGEVRGLELAAAAAGLVEPTTTEVEAHRPGVRVAGGDARAVIAAGLLGRLAWPVSPFLTIAVSGGAVAPFNARRYEVGTPAGRRVLVDPWPVRPWLLVGLELPIRL